MRNGQWRGSGAAQRRNGRPTASVTMRASPGRSRHHPGSNVRALARKLRRRCVPLSCAAVTLGCNAADSLTGNRFLTQGLGGSVAEP